MTLPVDQQNCGNCFFARTMPRVRSKSGPSGQSDASATALSCCYPVPGTMANPPSVLNPWREILPAFWCGFWSDVGLGASTGPQGPPGIQGIPGPQGIQGPGITVARDSALLDFGSQPAMEASTAVSGQLGITPTSHVRLSMQGDVVGDNGVDEHLLAAETVRLTAGIPILNSGFVIYGRSEFALWTGQLRVRWSWY